MIKIKIPVRELKKRVGTAIPTTRSVIRTHSFRYCDFDSVAVRGPLCNQQFRLLRLTTIFHRLASKFTTGIVNPKLPHSYPREAESGFKNQDYLNQDNTTARQQRNAGNGPVEQNNGNSNSKDE
ncbi:hypothetical protein TWF694_005874 [Orbilia ellipsospora]|uniref:Uncharacterized protein n=1 Tax=Orbilia ellipsospora TaxID=2528407 RepID=A0AAV9WSI6_9PEZI